MQNDPYSIIKLTKEIATKYESDYLVVIKEPMSFFDCECLECDFRKLNYRGKVIFDYILIFGTDEVYRIDIDYFNGSYFIEKTNYIYPTKDYREICNASYTYLRENPDSMKYAALTEQEREMIANGKQIA